MSKAEWLSVSMKCSETLVGLDLETGLSTVLQCSLKRSLSLRLVLNVLKFTAVTLDHVNYFQYCTASR